MALTVMEMILDWERGTHYVAVVVAEGVEAAAIAASGQDSRPHLLVQLLQRRCQWIRSSREGHCLIMPH